MRCLRIFFVPADAKGESWTDERCYITELHNTSASPEASLALARVEPGVTTQLHRLDGVCERYIVRRGEGILEVDGQRQLLGNGDQAVIPAGSMPNGTVENHWTAGSFSVQ